VDVVRPIFENTKDFRIKNIEAAEDFRYPGLRFTIDYPEDLEQARAVYAYYKGDTFTTRQLISLAKEQPALFEKTKNLVQKSAPHLSHQP
jgi:spore coat polysaccharide biosynthesis protein SpsF